jgi:hypothetical protein
MSVAVTYRFERRLGGIMLLCAPAPVLWISMVCKAQRLIIRVSLLGSESGSHVFRT